MKNITLNNKTAEVFGAKIARLAEHGACENSIGFCFKMIRSLNTASNLVVTEGEEKYNLYSNSLSESTQCISELINMFCDAGEELSEPIKEEKTNKAA